MIVTAHVVAGGVAGELLENWVLAFFAGIILHFLLDLIPHFDNPGNNKWNTAQIIFTSADFILAFILFFFVLKLPLNFSMLDMPLFWGAFGGFLPDLVDNVPFWNKRFRATKFGKRFHKFHDSLHVIKQPGVFFGMVTQILIVFMSLWLYFRSS